MQYFRSCVTNDGARVYGTETVSKRVKLRRTKMKPQVKSIYHSLVLGILISLFLICSPAWAVFDWVGGTGTDFDTAANWFGVAAPVVGNNADSLAFDVNGGANLTITGADEGAYAGFTGMSFTGALGDYSITGTGSLGFNTGTSIIGDGARTHTLDVNLVTVGEGLTFDGAASYIVSGVISGTIVIKSSTGTLTLSGDNSYTGGTTLNVGSTIILGHDDALGTGTLTLGGAGTIQASADGRDIGNAITLDNGLTVSGGFNLVLSGVISGASTLTTDMTADDDTLTLSGNNDYSGGTTLTQGTIILGHNAALGTGTLTLGGAGTLQSNNDARLVSNLIDLAGNALTVSGASNLALSGDISGAGATSTLTKEGAGTLTLTGVNTHVGLTTLNAGTLTGAFSLNGALPNGGLTLNGGTFKPGNSIGTVVIAGNYTQNAGSTLEVEVSKTGGNDFLDVGGTADIGGTINVLDISPAGSLIVTGDTFNIIEAGGVITDNGPTITDNSAVLSFAGLVSGNFYQLVAARQAFATAVGRAGGPLAAIDSDMANATGDYITLINALTALNSAQLNNAAEQLDPLPHASSTTISLRTNQRMAGNLANYLSARRSGIERVMTLNTQSREHQLLIADASSDPRMLAYVINENKRIARMQQDEVDSKIRGFFRPFGVFYEHDSTSKMTGFRAKAVGAQFGFDKNFRPDLLVGIGGGYSHSFIDFKESRGEGDADSFRVGPYASYFKDNYFIDASASFGYHNNENERDIRFGTINRTADSDYHAWDLSAYIGGGYDFPVKDWIVTPTTSLQYIRYRRESFKETGAGAAGLNVDAATSQSLRGKVGVMLSTVTELYGTKIVPELFAGWSHEFIDDEDIEARFVNGTAKFTTDVDDDWDDSVYFGAGLSALLKENISAFVRYEGEYSSGDIGDMGIEVLSVGVTVLF